MLRFDRSLLGASWTDEYGDPADPDAFEWLYAYSPYHAVEERQYPDVLFTTAAGDTRVDPFHARKMTALMQARARDTLVLLKTYEATGHGVGKPVSKEVAEAAERWAFLYDRLGLEAEA
jgi:prolyl oligopeptidase